MAKNLVNGTNIVIEESGDNISMDLSSSYNTNLQQEINDSFKENNTYSTTEKIVGTWIDGKPIYRKMYEFSNIPTGETKNTALGIDNLYRIVNWSGSVETNGTARSCFVSGIIPFVHYQLGNIYVANTGRETINSISVIIEYTKTTD